MVGLLHPDPCMWAPVEEVREVVRKAWQARSVIDAVAALRLGGSIPEKIKPYLPFATLFVNPMIPAFEAA